MWSRGPTGGKRRSHCHHCEQCPGAALGTAQVTGLAACQPADRPWSARWAFALGPSGPGSTATLKAKAPEARPILPGAQQCSPPTLPGPAAHGRSQQSLSLRLRRKQHERRKVVAPKNKGTIGRLLPWKSNCQSKKITSSGDFFLKARIRHKTGRFKTSESHLTGSNMLSIIRNK